MTLRDLRLVDQIKGFLDQDEGMRLYTVAREASEMGPMLEIGSYCGKSTLYLGTAARENKGVLFTIDHHRGSEEQQYGEGYFDPELYDEKEKKVDTFPHLRRTLEQGGLEDTVVPIVSSSPLTARMWATPLSLVFIDGGHTFKAAFNDYSCWARHIMPGGFLLIHDIFKDPAEGGQAPYHVYKLAMASGQFRVLEMTKTLGVLQRYLPGEFPDDLPQ
ncbi:MAG: class I SAM-dependent methyltransferase [Proteobacteria bacterium]|nr:class I SAM-dependent methyltransferase [Pseudomonadota bacterium]